MAPAARKQKSVAYLLWLLGFVGLCGVHRLYTERYLLGILYLFTFGFCFLGQLIDLLLIPDDVESFNHSLRQSAAARLTPQGPPSSSVTRSDRAPSETPALQAGSGAAVRASEAPLTPRTRALMADAKASMQRLDDQR